MSYIWLEQVWSLEGLEELCTKMIFPWPEEILMRIHIEWNVIPFSRVVFLIHNTDVCQNWLPLPLVTFNASCNFSSTPSLCTHLSDSRGWKHSCIQRWPGWPAFHGLLHQSRARFPGFLWCSQNLPETDRNVQSLTVEGETCFSFSKNVVPSTEFTVRLYLKFNPRTLWQ